MDTGATELFSMRTCPVCIEVYFQPVLKALRVRAIFLKPKFKDHKVTGSKPVSVSVLFRRLPSLWGRPRETSEG